MVLVQVGAQLVVGVHVYFFLQLTSHILVSIISAQMLVQLYVSGLVLCGATHLLLFLSCLLLLLILLGSFISLVVEGDDQLMLLGSC